MSDQFWGSSTAS